MCEEVAREEEEWRKKKNVSSRLGSGMKIPAIVFVFGENIDN